MKPYSRTFRVGVIKEQKEEFLVQIDTPIGAIHTFQSLVIGKTFTIPEYYESIKDIPEEERAPVVLLAVYGCRQILVTIVDKEEEVEGENKNKNSRPVYVFTEYDPNFTASYSFNTDGNLVETIVTDWKEQEVTKYALGSHRGRKYDIVTATKTSLVENTIKKQVQCFALMGSENREPKSHDLKSRELNDPGTTYPGYDQMSLYTSETRETSYNTGTVFEMVHYFSDERVVTIKDDKGEKEFVKRRSKEELNYINFGNVGEELGVRFPNYTRKRVFVFGLLG